MNSAQLLEKSAAGKSPLVKKHGWIADCLGWLFLLLSCLPFLAYCYLIQAVGANNISNDYLNISPLIEPIFTGGYDWSRFLMDTFMGTHCELVGTLTHIAAAMFMSWDARAELYIGLGIALVRAFLLCALLSEPDDGKWKYLLYGGVMSMVFSLSQASLFLYGETIFPIGFCTLGFTIGLFAIVKFRDKPPVAMSLMFFGGLLSSLSWGNFLPCWLCFFLALVLFKYRQKLDYAVCMLGLLASLAVYSYVRIREFSYATSTIALSSLFNWHLWLNLLGRPFCNDVGVLLLLLRFSSVTGLFVFLATLIAAGVLFQQKQLSSRARASIILAVYAMLSCWLISVFRNVIAPWYTAIGMSMWIGLWGLMISILKASARKQITTRFALRNLTTVLGVSIALIVAGLYVWTNRTYEDKQFFLQTRAPVSESTMRHFRTAPTYCEQFVFQWGDGKYRFLEQLCKPLEKYKLSAFADHQQWSLQGDFPLDNVHIVADDTAPPIVWLDSMQVLDSTKLTDCNDWRSYKHLNLGLANGSQVQWTIDLPSNVQSANFVTAFALSDAKAPDKENNSGITRFVIREEEPNKSRGSNSDALWLNAVIVRPKQWYPVELPLTKYKGKRIVLSFAATSDNRNQTRLGLFQYPHIDVTLAKTASAPTSPPEQLKSAKPIMKEFPIDPTIKPTNTDLSPDMVRETASDLCFPYISSNFWHNQTFTENELIVNGTAQGMHDKSSPLLCSKNQLDIHLSQYSHLLLEAQTQMSVHDCRTLITVFNFADGLSYHFSLPLLPDGQMHKYSYDLKLLDADANRTLDQIFLRPVNQSGEPLSSTIRIKSIRLMHKSR